MFQNLQYFIPSVYVCLFASVVYKIGAVQFPYTFGDENKVTCKQGAGSDIFFGVDMSDCFRQVRSTCRTFSYKSSRHVGHSVEFASIMPTCRQVDMRDRFPLKLTYRCSCRCKEPALQTFLLCFKVFINTSISSRLFSKLISR